MDPGQHDDRHAVDIQLGCTAEPTSYCAVCKQPLVSVTVGGCGHAVACSSSTCVGVCCTRGAAQEAPELAQPALKEGKAGEYWYHGDTALHVDNEQEDEEERGKKPRYILWVCASVNFYS